MGSDSPRFILRYVPGVPPNRVTTGTLDIETRIGVCHACYFVAETGPTGCRLFSNGLGLRERPSRAAIATAHPTGGSAHNNSLYLAVPARAHRGAEIWIYETRD